MKQWFRPTLMRRIVAALILAFLLAWTVLVGYQYIEFKHAMAQNSGLRQIGMALSLELDKINNADHAKVAVAVTADQFNTLRGQAGRLPGSLVYQLWDRNGQLIYTSTELGAVILAGDPNQVIDRNINGTMFWVFQQDTPRWSLRIAEPRVTDATVLTWFGSDLIPYLLLAFPFVLLPIVIAVYQGLRPLRRLTALISARPADDLSPIGLDLKYAELKPVVSAFESLLENLRSKVQRERELVQDAAHELQTPMAVIIAQAHLVSQAVNSSERQAALNRLDNAISRASHLTQQLLELNALDESQQRELKRIDIAHLVRQAIAQRAANALTRRIDLSLDAPEELYQSVDVAAFHSILHNLLDNALRYVPEGGRIAVSLHTTDGMMTLLVADNGPGIPEEERERIFERFYRGRGHDTPGSGLGLAIVKQATARMRGHIKISPGLDNRGCQFRVCIPFEVQGKIVDSLSQSAPSRQY